jgi:two-component sensor histidine kinase
MPEEFAAGAMDSLGIQLIQALTDQLEGEMQLVSMPNEGVKFIIEFKRIS